MRIRLTLATAAALSLPMSLIAGPAVADESPASVRDSFYAQDLTPFQWWLEPVNVPAAHAAGHTGEGVVVAVVDTGVDGTHPDLAGRVLDGISTETGELIELNGAENNDPHGHGTHVSGIIAASDDGKGVTGVAPEVSIMPVRVLDSWGGGSSDSIASGVDWAVANGAHIINMSLGGGTQEITLTGDYDEMCSAVERAYEAGVAVVVAAGNDGEFGNVLATPAGCPGSLSVASVEPSGRPSWFTSFDPSVAVSAPGSEVFSTVPADIVKSGYASWSGTSMATPVVAGTLALAKAADPGATGEDLYEKAKNTARDMGRTGRDPLYGAGVVSATGVVGLEPGTPSWPETVHVVNAYPTSDGKSTVIGWRPSVGLDAASYTLRSYPEMEILAEVDGNQVRARIEPTFGTAMAVQVVANIADGTSVAAAPIWVGAEDGGDGGGGEFEIVQAEGTWTKEGLRVKVTYSDGSKVTSTKAKEDLDLTFYYGLLLYDSSTGVPESGPLAKKAVLKKGQGSVLVPVAKNHPARGTFISIVINNGMSTGGQWLREGSARPQWPVSVSVEKLNNRQVLVSGAVNACVRGGYSPVCSGGVAVIADRQGRSIGRAIVNNEGRYSLVLTDHPKALSAVFGSWKSPTFPAKWLATPWGASLNEEGTAR